MHAAYKHLSIYKAEAQLHFSCVAPAWETENTCALDTVGAGRRRRKKTERKEKWQESLKSVFMCLPLHLHCTAELLPSAAGEAGNAKHTATDAASGV